MVAIKILCPPLATTEVVDVIVTFIIVEFLVFNKHLD